MIYVKKKGYKHCEFIENEVRCPTQPSFNMEGTTIEKFCTSFQLNWEPTMQIWEIPEGEPAIPFTDRPVTALLQRM